MPSIYFTPDHDEFRRQVRRFMEQEIAPQADAWEETMVIPREAFAALGRLGFLGITFPEEYGGSGADLMFAVIFLEELTRSRLGGFCAAVSVQQFMATQHIFRFGSEELKRAYLMPSIAGDKVGALAITEPDTGSDVAAIRTKAVRQGGDWVIDGAKTFITNGALGDFYTLAVKTDPTAGAGGVSLIVVDRETPGVSARPPEETGLALLGHRRDQFPGGAGARRASGGQVEHGVLLLDGGLHPWSGSAARPSVWAQPGCACRRPWPI